MCPILRVVDPHLFYADPDSGFFSNADPIMLIIKVMRIYEHWSQDPPGLHFKPPRLHCERTRPSAAPFRASKKLLNFDFHADPDLAFHYNTDPNSAFQNNAITDPQPCPIPPSPRSSC